MRKKIVLRCARKKVFQYRFRLQSERFRNMKIVLTLCSILWLGSLCHGMTVPNEKQLDEIVDALFKKGIGRIVQDDVDEFLKDIAAGNKDYFDNSIQPTPSDQDKPHPSYYYGDNIDKPVDISQDEMVSFDAVLRPTAARKRDFIIFNGVESDPEEDVNDDDADESKDDEVAIPSWLKFK